MGEHTKLVLEILVPLILMMGWVWKNLSKKIDEKTDNLSKKIDENTKEINKLGYRIQKIENRLEYSNKIVYVQHEESKEN